MMYNVKMKPQKSKNYFISFLDAFFNPFYIDIPLHYSIIFCFVAELQVLGLGLGVDFVFPLSQEQEPPPKFL